MVDCILQEVWMLSKLRMYMTDSASMVKEPIHGDPEGTMIVCMNRIRIRRQAGVPVCPHSTCRSSNIMSYQI